MEQTLGSFCDKFSIVKLKQHNCDNIQKAQSLSIQEGQLVTEMIVFLADAIAGRTPVERLSFSANKVYKQAGNELFSVPGGSIGEAFAELSKVNCDLWNEQEKRYAFETVRPFEKDRVLKQLALLNLRCNQCIDAIDKVLIRQM
jgi:hypothetical protein